ncbi:type II secretion system F family protein [Massilia sp. IC2-477]|uniref:type II secretion system F family protein n=1 Tax=Massilia sp. IC2-477 TaxID=2887198 RepID=UPI001D1293A0|nr:type II secretion system F family protein [Massilia sp. IC2-477]MCC2955095.1 type II secretion system F family protein [Massilia sp. IC2-477]
MDALFYAFVVFLFAAVILAIEGTYLWWVGTHGKAARRVARRLQTMSGSPGRSGERISILKQRPYSRNAVFDRLLHRLGLANRIDALLVQAGVAISVAQFLAWSVGCMAAVSLLALSWPLPLAARVLLAVLGLAAPWMLVRRARTRRLIHIERQLPEAADFIARALRAGHSFSNVLQIVGNELPEPLSGEFRIAREEINYGVPINEALHAMAARIPLTDLRYLIIAVLIQRDSGGNLAEILGNISQIIRARLKLVAHVRVLSAEGRMSAWILGLLPFAVAGMMLLTNPQYLSLLWTDPLGVRMLWYAAAMLVFGFVWLRKIIRIRI